jgi:hypothetical protein
MKPRGNTHSFTQSTSLLASPLTFYPFLPPSNRIRLAAPSVLPVASIFRHL